MRFFCFLVLGLGLLSCANDSVTVSVRVEAQNQTTADLIAQAGTQVRFLYTNEDLNGLIRVTPTRAGPTCDPCPPEPAPVFFWEQAFNSGSSASGTVSIPNLALNVRGTAFAIEFLQIREDPDDDNAEKLFVVAYGCFQDRTGEPLSGADLKATFDDQALTIYPGKTCGELCPTPPEISEPTDSCVDT